MKGVVRFEKKGKFIPHYVAPYEMFQRVGEVSYELKLLSELSFVHPFFHVSMHKKCIGDPETIFSIGGLVVQVNLSYEEVPVQLFDRQVTSRVSKRWLM